ncbi:MAG: hypothetical protein Q8N53_12905 [Longimicrobiales bacterium]|nr:hypothetical protein [Longimicrobiales bacterium]
MGIEVERSLHDLDVHHEVFASRDGADGQDREWRLALRYEGAAPGFGSAVVGLRANGGLSLRWNRDYIQYSGNAALGAL